jgi:hypothetical protein
MEHIAPAEDKPGITAIKPYQDKQRNISGQVTVTVFSAQYLSFELMN